MISTPFSRIFGLGRSESPSNIANTTYQTALNQSTISHGTQMPSVSVTPITSGQLSLHRNLNQLVDEGQRASFQNKRELINHVDQLSTLSFLNSSAGVNVQRIQDQFEQIDRTLLMTAPTIRPKESKDDSIVASQLDGKLNTNLNDYLKREREKTLLTILRSVEDQVMIETISR